MPATDSILMVVGGLTVDPVSKTPIVVLRDEENTLTLPIWVGMLEATATSSELEGTRVSRPLTHDLVRSILDSVEIEVTVRYQACNDDTCLLPRTETFTLGVPMDVTEVPAIPIHQGHGQREGNYDGTPHFKRLLARKPSTRKPI